MIISLPFSTRVSQTVFYACGSGTQPICATIPIDLTPRKIVTVLCTALVLVAGIVPALSTGLGCVILVAL